MTSLVLTNNAQSTLASALTTGATQLTVAAGQGARFPNPGPNEWFPLTLIPADGSGCEIVRATSRAGDDIEIVREQEGTTAVALAAGDYVLHQMTAAAHLDLASAGTIEIETSAGTSSAYTVAIPSITSLEDGLAFSFVAHTDNVGSATLKVGTLAAKGLRKYAYAGGGTIQALGSNEILGGKQVLVHYEAANDVFVVSNPNPPAVPSATSAVEGTVMIASDPQTYNTGGENTKPVTQRTASQIVEEAIDDYDSTTADRPLPKLWDDLGTGAGGTLTVLPASNASLLASNLHQYDTIDIQDTGELNIVARGVCIIRCTTSFNCDGIINFPQGGGIGAPQPVIGPTGSVNGTYSHDAQRTECNFLPALQPGRAQPANSVWNTFDGFRATKNEVEMAIQSGYPMHLFQGGNGAVYRETNQSLNKGGLIIIAPTITLGSTCIINNMNPVPEGNFVSNPSHGPSAGGMLILVEDNGNAAGIIDPACQIEAAGDSGAPPSTSAHRTASQLAADPDFITGPPGAANGQCFTVSRNTGFVQMVF